jgi:protein-tyrosine phosphatase
MTLPLVDLHSHVLPGVDDGAQDLASALDALEALAAVGVERVVATPHFRASLFERGQRAQARLALLDEAAETLRAAVLERGIAIDIGRGCEFKLDAPVSDLSDPRLRLEGTRYALVEFGSFQLPPFAANQLRAVRDAGHVPLLAHPERYIGIEAVVDRVGEWVAEGTLLQVNVRSLTGGYGAVPRRVALELLARGWVCCVASDYHARGDTEWRDALALLAGAGTRDAADPIAVRWARDLVYGNPRRILADEPTEEVAPRDLDPRRTGWV